jgi:hypothetical protein
MIKGLPMLLLAAFVLAGSPSRGEEAAATAPVPLFLAVPASSCAMSSAAAPNLPQFLPKPESRIIVCGCGDIACNLKKPYAGCTVDGSPGSCQPGPVCDADPNRVDCYCGALTP